MSSDAWYYGRLGAQQGPISGDELRRLAGSGQITPNTLVWRDGWADWRPASTVEGLFPKPPPLPGGPAAPTQGTAEPAHLIQNGVCERCGCTETYIISMGKAVCRGGASSPAPAPLAQTVSSEPTAKGEPGILFALGAFGALFGVRQLLFVDSGQGVVILVVSAVVMLIGSGAPTRGNENRMR